MNDGTIQLDTRRNVPLLAMAQAGLVSSTMTMVSFGGLFGKEVAPSAELATLPISLSIAAAAMSTPLMSGLMGRIGRRNGFLCGLGVGLLAWTLMIFAALESNFLMLCIAAVLMGPFHAGGQYYRFAAMESAPDGRAGSAVSIVLLGSIFAAFAIPWLSTWGERWFEGSAFAGLFLVAALLALVSVLPLGLLKRGRKETRHDEPGNGMPARSLSEIVRQPVYIVSLVNGMGAQAMMAFVMTATPLAMEVCGFDRIDGSEVIRNHILAMFLPGLVSGRLIDRFGATNMMFAGQILFALAFIVALSGISRMHFNVALILLGIGWNFGFVSATNMLSKAYRPAETSRALGLNEFLVYGTAAVGSAAAGAVQIALGWEAVNLSVLVILGGTLAVTLWYVIRQDREATENAEC